MVPVAAGPAAEVLAELQLAPLLLHCTAAQYTASSIPAHHNHAHPILAAGSPAASKVTHN